MPSFLYPENPVLLVDDEKPILESWSIALESVGINNTVSCADSRQVMRILAKKEAELILLDLSMPFVSGEELLARIYAEYPDMPVIIVTGTNDVATAVECMKAGAFDYMIKAVEKNRLISGVKRAIENRQLQRENRDLKRRLFSDDIENPEAFADIIAASGSKMRSVFLYVEAIAKTLQTVLITGETGVGKELIARAIHILSGRRGEYVIANIAGFDEAVFTDTLFGHKPGAFTDAKQPRKGLVEKASEGTLFLDEIGDLSIPSQVKLLRLMETREYYPLGSDMAKRCRSKIIVATNRNLDDLVANGQFRKDLYYRLSVHEVNVPPLRERIDDLLLLIDHFLSTAAREFGKKKPTPPKELYTLLATYYFPGNVRELKSLIYDAVSRHKSGTLSLEHFKAVIGKKSRSVRKKSPLSALVFPEFLPTLKEVSNLLIKEALQRSSGNQ